MNIRVKDCLPLPSMANSTVIAGHKGLDNIVARVSVLEYDGAIFFETTKFLSANELLLSSFHSLKNSVDLQCHAIEYFSTTGTVALILFYVGIYLDSVHPKVIETANRLNFPIIVLPTDISLRYSDVISEVMELVLDSRNQETDFVENISNAINRFSTPQKHIDNLLRILSDQTRFSYVLLSNSNQIISERYWPPRATIEITPILQYFSQNPQADIYVRSADDEFLCCYPMEVSFPTGYSVTLLCIDRTGQFSPSLKPKLIQCIKYFSIDRNYTLNSSAPGALIPAILCENRSWLQTVCNNTAIQPSAIDGCMFIHSDGAEGVNANQHILHQIHDFVAEHGLSVVVDSYNEFIIILTMFRNNQEIQSWLCTKLSEQLRLTETGIYLSARYDMEDKNSIRRNFVQYCDNLPTAQIIYPYKRSFSPYEIDLAGRCNRILSTAHDEKNRLIQWLQPLSVNIDDSLLETLCTFVLDANCEIKMTAQILFLHRNTVQYRLSKIRALLRADFSQMPLIFDTYLACAIYRTEQNSSSNPAPESIY